MIDRDRDAADDWMRDHMPSEDPLERVLAIDPENAGVRLWRVLEQSLGLQRA